jgi:hypothetical protein
LRFDVGIVVVFIASVKNAIREQKHWRLTHVLKAAKKEEEVVKDRIRMINHLGEVVGVCFFNAELGQAPDHHGAEGVSRVGYLLLETTTTTTIVNTVIPAIMKRNKIVG